MAQSPVYQFEDWRCVRHSSAQRIYRPSAIAAVRSLRWTLLAALAGVILTVVLFYNSEVKFDWDSHLESMEHAAALLEEPLAKLPPEAAASDPELARGLEEARRMVSQVPEERAWYERDKQRKRIAYVAMLAIFGIAGLLPPLSCL